MLGNPLKLGTPFKLGIFLEKATSLELDVASELGLVDLRRVLRIAIALCFELANGSEDSPPTHLIVLLHSAMAMES